LKLLTETDMIGLAQKHSPVSLEHAGDVILVWFEFERDWAARFRPKNKIVMAIIESWVKDESLISDARLRAVPALAHELCHYEQYKRLGLLWWIFCIPGIRDLTIEREAYRVEDAVREAIFGELE